MFCDGCKEEKTGKKDLYFLKITQQALSSVLWFLLSAWIFLILLLTRHNGLNLCFICIDSRSSLTHDSAFCFTKSSITGSLKVHNLFIRYGKLNFYLFQSLLLYGKWIYQWINQLIVISFFISGFQIIEKFLKYNSSFRAMWSATKAALFLGRYNSRLH